MRKSTLGLAIIIEILALFVFENMRALVVSLEKNETAAVVSRSELQAELHVLRILQGVPPRGPEKFFDRVLSLPRPESGQRVFVTGKERHLEIKKPLGAGSGLLFQKSIRSVQIDALRALKRVLSGLVVLLGIVLAISGIYLMVMVGRKKPVPTLGAGSPFQDYLVEMKNAQMELQDLVAAKSRSSSEKEELNRSIINTVHLGVIFLSAAGKIEIFNPAAQKLFGRSFASVKNRLLPEALPGHAELARFILDSEGRASAEVESGPFIFYVDTVPVGDGGRLALVRDVSAERKREMVQRQGANLMMLGEMAASLAHEIRNSLGVVLGYSKAMSSEPDKTRRITREIEFLSEMMESFLNFARPVEKVSLHQTDLAQLIRAAAAAQEMRLDLPAGPMELKSDPLLLNVVFSNLFLNARQAGATRLQVEFEPGASPAITIADDGPGITVANARKIWLPFFSTRDKGTGMGLATVKKLVSALNGDIQLLNPGEKGARFRIVFYG
jgi:signal transduction histidine kinase